jgi:hypothetical protein
MEEEKEIKKEEANYLFENMFDTLIKLRYFCLI